MDFYHIGMFARLYGSLKKIGSNTENYQSTIENYQKKYDKWFDVTLIQAIKIVIIGIIFVIITTLVMFFFPSTSNIVNFNLSYLLLIDVVIFGILYMLARIPLYACFLIIFVITAIYISVANNTLTYLYIFSGVGILAGIFLNGMSSISISSSIWLAIFLLSTFLYFKSSSFTKIGADQDFFQPSQAFQNIALFKKYLFGCIYLWIMMILTVLSLTCKSNILIKLVVLALAIAFGYMAFSDFTPQKD